jgi:catechol 2,3-dioxygenase-like lactoylglutathione lyase family enzyme
MFDHIGILIRAADRSLPFYEACLAPLGIRKTQEQPQWRAAVFMIPGARGFLWIGAGAADQPQQRLSGYFHLAFSAPDEAAVRAFHAAGLAAGGTDNGAPGFRRPDYFAAFVFDPDGNNIEASWRVAQPAS